MAIKNKYFGYGAINNLSYLLEAYDPRMILLFSGKNSFTKSGVNKPFTTMLDGRDYVMFQDFSSNPKYEDIKLGIQQYRKLSPDLIISVGGGTCIDVAKLVNAFALNTELKLDYAIKHNTGIVTKQIPHICIPTTFGTGSEATQFAVAYHQKQKYSIDAVQLKPDHVIIDPEYMQSLSSYQAACVSFDALCQAIESHWSLAATKQSKKYSQRAIRIIISAMRDAILHKDKQAIAKMSLAAHLAGCAINITRTTAPHALSYYLTSEHGIAHGHAVALMLQHFLLINNNYDKYGLNLHKNLDRQQFFSTQQEIYQALGCESAKQCNNIFRQLMLDLGLAVNFQQLGIDDVNVSKKLIESVNTQRLANHPIQLNSDNLQLIFADMSL